MIHLVNHNYDITMERLHDPQVSLSIILILDINSNP